MNIVISRPKDDDEIVEVYIVQHKSKSGNMFQIEWDSVLAQVKEAIPDEWDVNDVFKRMESLGWDILHVKDPVGVTY